MESIVPNVRDIETDERRVLEHVLGRQLLESQKVIVQIVDADLARERQVSKCHAGMLPDWCGVFDGLTDEQVTAVEAIALQRADLARSAE